MFKFSPSTKAFVVILLVLIAVVGSSWGANLYISPSGYRTTGTVTYDGNFDFANDSNFNLSGKIYNSNGLVLNASGTNLQIACDDLMPKGGTVYVSAEEITITNLTIGCDAISIVGAMWRSSFYTNQIRLLASASCTDTMIFSQYNETHIENILFYGRGQTSGTYEDGIKFGSRANCGHIVGCAFNSINGTAINITGGGVHSVEKCRGMNIGRYFLLLKGNDCSVTFCDATASKDVFYIDGSPNRFIDCNGYLSESGSGFYTGSAGDRTSFTNCNSYNNAVDGFNTYASSGTIINGCSYIHNNGRRGISLIGSSDSIVSNNYITESDESGIFIGSTTQNCVIMGNTIKDSGEDASITDMYETGIYINDGKNNTIIGNRCSGSKYGIYEDYYERQSNDTIIGNNLNNNDVAPYSTDGNSNSTIAFNRGFENFSYLYIPCGNPYSSPYVGATRLNTTTGEFAIGNGTAWVWFAPK